MGRVLIVDDNEDIRAMMRLILESEGYEVSTAADGQAALGQLRVGETPCLILLDLMMPGMNGWRFREEQLKDEALRRIPVVILSGDGRVTDKSAALGAADCIQKPVELESLLSVVRSFCGPPA